MHNSVNKIFNMNINSIKTTNLESILIKENIRESDSKAYPNESCHKIQNYSDNKLEFDKLETKRIVHINTIKKICIDYRLRFLDINFFKGEIPLEAIDKIKSLELEHNTKIDQFKIMAPSIMFRLKKTDDPLLFTPLGNNYFYLIHKWGNDLKGLRRLRMWPFLSLKNLLFTLLIVSYLLTLITPLEIFSKNPDSSSFWLLYLFMFKAIVSIVLFLGVSLGKSFNPQIWNSKYNKS
ncbi:MAG: hypothetical protein CMC04_01530 [Flavobacteriaceae bacterium]|nr:hypothetical protein [Flavobacteriaceae bacterium]